MATKPIAEVEVDVEWVRQLLRSQFPDLADLPLAPLASGWDNVLFRLGEDLLVRLPRRKLAVQLIRNEQRLLPWIAPRLPLSVPVPVQMGQPDCGYPWHWSVAPWFPGEPADLSPLSGSSAAMLGEFLVELHRDDVADAPENPFRGGPLAERAPYFQERWGRLRNAGVEEASDAVLRQWELAVEAPSASESRWIHGDLHPQNLLVDAGRISAVIDWGDLTAADIATDLSAAWMLFEDARDREALLAVHPLVDEAVVHRARGWAIHLGTTFLDVGLGSDPRSEAIGRATLRRVAQ